MQTIDLELASKKLHKLDAALNGTLHIPSNAPGLAVYFAAKAARNAMLRTGHERQLMAAKKALKQCNVIVSSHFIPERGIRRVRVFIPTKQIEILL